MDSSVANLIKNLRKIINNPRKQYELIQRSGDWSKLCTCIDTIEDTESAIEYYLRLKDFDAHTGGYLFIYGLLQALFLQQDAIGNLHDGIFESSKYLKDILERFQELRNIREIRNDSIGHPTNRGGKSYHSIVQHSINKNGFELYSDFDDEVDKFKNINLIEIIKVQRDVIAYSLKGILRKLEEEETLHKKIYSDNKLQNFFIHRHYCIEKLSNCLYSDETSSEKEDFAFRQLDIFEESYLEFIDEIKERYGFILDSIKHYQPKIEYVFSKIKKFKANEGLNQNIEATVLVDILNYYLRELELAAKDVDKEYSV
ncbi:MAG: hypothetical protein ACREV6_05920 [Clostridium sp.]|uniref:hypothetical protein n=1 Tax=Clostridium sp. TaxID=1506 RepID=UPI003D6D3253